MRGIDTLPGGPTRTGRRIEESIPATHNRTQHALDRIGTGKVHFLRDVAYQVRPSQELGQRTRRLATAMNEAR
eukprot:7076670-Alexandrium_andersonii.AAC.1